MKYIKNTPDTKNDKINTFGEALKYCVEHKKGTITELKEKLTDYMIEQLLLTGMITK